MHMYGHMHHVESGEDVLDALSCRSLFAKEPLIMSFLAESDAHI